MTNGPAHAQRTPNGQISGEAENGLVDAVLECPLSEGQAGLWTLYKMAPDMAAYNLPLCLRITGGLDRDAFRHACNAVLRRYPLLASHVASADYKLVLRYPEAGATADIPEEDISHLGEGDLAEFLRDRLRRPFVLEQGPLLRVTLFTGRDDTVIALFVIHHMAFDGASLPPFLKTLLTAYHAHRAGTAQDGADLGNGFADFVAWERELLASPEGDAQLRYWKETLAGELPVLELPLDHARPAQRGFGGRTKKHRLSGSAAEALDALAQRNYLTPSALFLALFNTMLYRYTGQEDIVVGMPVMGRPKPEFADMVGYFVNMLAIRNRIDGDRTFSEVADSVQLTLMDGLDHADYPFTTLVRKLGVERKSFESPIFQVGFYYQNYIQAAELDDLRALTSGDLKVEVLDLVRQEGEYELALEVYRQEDGFMISLKYDPELFSEQRIGLMIGHLETLAEAVAADPDRPVRDYPLLTAGETALLARWQGVAMTYPVDRRVHQFVDERAAAHPDRTALVCGERTMTYGALAERSGALAAHLRGLGVKAGDLVALCVERSTDMVVGMLGIMKAGAAYVPLDPEYPTDRLSYMLEDANVSAVLVQQATRDRLGELQSSERPVVVLDDDWSGGARTGDVRSPTDAEAAGTLAYVIYTSGSTGKPKGVMIGHRALTNFLLSMAEEPGFGPDDRLLAVTTYCFDIAGLELFLPLIRGGQCVICESARARNPEWLKDEIERHRPTVMQATPATWTMLYHSGWKNGGGIKILCGGEALPEPLKDQFAQDGSEVWNMFGPTETTIWSTVSRVHPDRPVTIGRPIANTRIHIVDRAMGQVPIGVPGELCIAGDGVAEGYLNRPELTAEKFVPNPFAESGRLYRTGDLARWRQDGEIEYLGRLDHQVKIRGFRIELEEIENALNKHPAVAEAVVVAKELHGTKQLVGYYIPADGNPPPAADPSGADSDAAGRTLRAFLRESLPDYMVPAHLVALDAFPLTPNGKRDRKALMARPLEVAAPRRSSEAAGNDTEKVILEIWRQVLGNTAIGVEDAFFEVGGDSLTAVFVTERISETFGCTVTVTSLFRYPDVKRLAAFVDRRLRESAEGRSKGAAPTPTRMAEGGDAEAGLPDYYDNALAIIGVSCRYPQAADHRAFWGKLCDGQELFTLLGEEELRRAGLPDDLIRNPDFVPVRSLIDGKDKFDPDFFNIMLRDAEFMDPQMRLLLQHSWHAVEDAGYRVDAVRRTGVFMSASNSFYHALLPNIAPQTGKVLAKPVEYVAWVLAQGGSIPTMISYKLGLKGPSFFVHSNCSSSLVGLHLARQSLLSGECDQALVGAAAVSPSSMLGYVHERGLNFSADGHVKAFDASADGMIGGEGVAVVLVKRARDAVRDGDNIYALIRGTAVNNDGADKVGFYAPSVGGQSEVIDQALKAAAVDPATISYVEAHGTGTKLGDPIELAALTEAYARHTDRTGYCGIGSVKTNLGHLDAAAGLAGCIKVALALKHARIPGTLNYTKPNPDIDFENSPFYVVDRTIPWPEGMEPARAALSSFGLGGTNTHAVLERPPILPTMSEGDPEGEDTLHLLPLSARTDERLTAYARTLLAYLETDAARDVALADVAYTMQVGRMPMASRVAFLAKSRRDWTDQLRAYCDGREAAGTVTPAQDGTKAVVARLGRSDDTSALIASWCRAGDHEAVARAWVSGQAVDWPLGHAGRRPRRVSLPGYPFAEERYWAAEVFGGAPTAAAGEVRLHPLLHRNTSDLAEQRFSSTFSGREFFLGDHVILGKPVLPAVAYLEMAHAAATRAIRDYAEASQAVAVTNVVWSRPIAVSDGPVTVHIALSPDVNGDIAYRVYTGGETEEGGSADHSLGTVKLVPRDAPPARNLGELTALCADGRIDPETCYEAFRSAGVDYGPGHQGMVELAIGAMGGDPPFALAKLAVPDGFADTRDAYVLHPCLLDSALQACLALKARDGSRQATLPYALSEIIVYRRCPSTVWAVVQKAPGAETGSSLTSYDIDLCDEQGSVCVRLRGFVSRAIDTGRAADAARADHQAVLLAPEWVEAPITPLDGRQAPERRVRIICDIDTTGSADDDTLVLRDDGDDPPRRFTRYALAIKRRLSDLIAAKAAGATLVQVAIPAGPDAPPLAGLAGMLKSIRQEHPAILAQLVEIDARGLPGALEDALDAGTTLAAHVHVRWRDGAIRVPEWTQAAPSSGEGFSWRRDGVYLVTGGSGKIGLKIAREIAALAPDARIVLTGRSDPETFRARIGDADIGDGFDYVQADIADREAVEGLIGRILDRHGALHGIVHAAGFARDGLIVRKSDEDFARVLAPKVDGTALLDEATRDLPLDVFLLVSSISGVFGNVGQTDYAAANGFLDAFARWRQVRVEAGARSGRTLSIDWPLWKDGGIAIPEAVEKSLEREQGLYALPDAAAMAVLRETLAGSLPQVAVLYGDRDRIVRGLRPAEQAPEASERTPVTVEPEAVPAMAAGGADDAGLLEKTVRYLKTTIAEAIRMPVDRINAGETFDTFGIDSIMITELINLLEKTFGSLPKTLFFEYQTLQDLGGYFVKSHEKTLRGLFGLDDAAPKASPAPAAKPVAAPSVTAPVNSRFAPTARTREAPRDAVAHDGVGDIAIIGLSGRYPKARNVQEFWENLRDGLDCITEIPSDRWDHSIYFDEDKNKFGKTYSKWGGFLDDVDKFDAMFFNISPREAEYMDPQERIFMECVYEAIEDAGYTRETLAPTKEFGLAGNVGVFAGMMYEEYQLYGAQETLQGRPIALSGSPASIANRVSYFCNFHGPSMAVDTMCSSSLTAIHIACLSLQRGDCEVAVAGGVNVSVHPNKYLMLGQGKFVSSKGRCESFGLGGDGYVPGEGAGVAILKPLDRAIRDGDQIYAVIKGSALNHGGKTSGYSVPNPNAQAAVIRRAIERSGIDPRTLSYIEAHGTGTALGDPIEIAALAKAFAEYTSDTGFCAIGSAKSNIGHCESAAGIGGLTKVLLQMKHGKLVPSLHSEVLNPHIDFDKTPFIVQQTLADWEPPTIEKDGMSRTHPRRAGISSFGAGGSNAHLIVEEYRPAERASAGAAVRRPLPIVLSAKTEGQLKKAAGRLLDAVRAGHYTEDQLPDIAFTLQVGREAMDHRAAMAVGSLDQLREKLAAFVEGRKGQADIHVGHVRSNSDLLTLFSGDDDMTKTVETWLAKGKVNTVCNYWVKGGAVNWTALYADARPTRISLPSYPFERERFWVPEIELQPDMVQVGDRRPTRPFDARIYESVIDDLLLDRVTVEEATRKVARV